MLPYAQENFSEEESEVLRRYFTNVHGPVFALVNLPEVVKGALFARYSRSAKSLRRLFLDEFVGDLDTSADVGTDATVGLERAERLYERVFLEYGDDSVAQLGGVHLACEQASNLLTKVLERGRLMAYLEQSTRYVAYDSRLSTGHYRYYRDPDVLESQLGARYVGDMDRMFDTYAELLPRLQAFFARRFPQRQGDSDFVYRQSIKAKALDTLRGLLPAGSLSNVGIYGTGQSYEMLVLRMRSSPLSEARRYAELVLDELRKVIPSFLRRLDIAERGGEWASYLAGTRERTAEVLSRLWPDTTGGTEGAAWAAGPATSSGSSGPSGSAVTLVDFDPEGEDKVLAAICYPQSSFAESELLGRVRRLSSEERAAIFRAYVGERTNRRHRPGRAFERTYYRFEVTGDYGAFRDLQRHRMLTIEWQDLGPELGFDIPEALVEAGFDQEYATSLERSASLYGAMRERFRSQAAYAVALAYRIRFTMQMNAREAMHLVELRSSEQGHPNYRRVAQQMHRLIAQQAGHRHIAEAMAFTDFREHELERLSAERRAEERRASVAT